MNKIKVKCFNNSKYPLPKQQTKEASGFDLHANITEDLILEPNVVEIISTGLFMEIPKGYEGQIRARSGLSSKYGIILVNGIGTIDSDYRGEIKVIMMNVSKEPFILKPGERIAQIVFVPIEIPEIIEVDSIDNLTSTDRDSGGFGHTGK